MFHYRLHRFRTTWAVDYCVDELAGWWPIDVKSENKIHWIVFLSKSSNIVFPRFFVDFFIIIISPFGAMGRIRPLSVSVVSRLSLRGWLALCRLAIAPICQLVQSSCQAFTATVTAPGAKSHCTSPWQAVPYSTVVHLPRTRTLGNGLWEALIF